MFKIQNEASAVGLTVVRKAEKDEISAKRHHSYYLYKFNDCNHSQFICSHKVRSGKFTCRTCIKNRLASEVEEAGLTLIEYGDSRFGKHSSDHSLYLINSCGHTKTINKNAVRNKQFLCQVCVELKYDKEALDRDLTMIRTDENTGEILPYKHGDRLYMFNKCGHKKSINMEDVRTGHFWCNECQAIKIENEASNANLTYLRKATIEDMSTEVKNHGFFRFNDCGHEQALSKTAVRTGHFKCSTCNISSKFKPSSVYLYKIETQYFSWLKLGFSSNPEFRGKKYNITTDYKSTLLSLMEFSTGEAANKFERSLHNLFKSYRLDADYMKKYMKCSGFTECYPTDLELQLLSELNKFKENNGQ